MDYQRKKKGHGVNDLWQQSWSGSDADFAQLHFEELLLLRVNFKRIFLVKRTFPRLISFKSPRGVNFNIWNHAQIRPFCVISSVTIWEVLALCVCCSFFSWTDSMCVFKVPFDEKLCSQVEHLYFFLFSWTASVCVFKCTFLKKLLSQIEHLWGFFLSWNESTWFFNCSFCG